MQIEYTTPQADYLDVEVTLTEPDGMVGAAECLYKPEPIAGLRMIPVGRFKATGQSGRVEEATVQFDLRKCEFVIQPKKLVAGGFDFDKPTQPEPTQAESGVTEPATKDTQPQVLALLDKVLTPNKK